MRVCMRVSVQLQLQNQVLSWALRDENRRWRGPSTSCVQWGHTSGSLMEMAQVTGCLKNLPWMQNIKWGAVQKRRKEDKGLRMHFCISQFQSPDISQDMQHFNTSKMQLMEANCAIFFHLHPPYFEWLINKSMAWRCVINGHMLPDYRRDFYHKSFHFTIRLLAQAPGLLSCVHSWDE